MKQLLQTVPEIVVTVAASKIGRRHPWSFTSAEILAGKTVRLVCDRLSAEQRDELARFASRVGAGIRFNVEEAGGVATDL
jgi:hypothetical protein